MEKHESLLAFYKEWLDLWNKIRGDELNHAATASDRLAFLTDFRSPYVQIIEEALRFAAISVEKGEEFPGRVVDVGCGVGSASRYFAAKYGVKCVGINICPIQVDQANYLASVEGLADKATYQVADAMDQPLGDNQFDLIWCMESAEHMSDRKKLVSELARVAAPGGTIILITSCQRDLRPGERSISLWEKIIINSICRVCYYPSLCSSDHYINLMESCSLEDIKERTTSELHAPLWSMSMRAILTWKGFTSTLTSGLQAIRGVVGMIMLAKLGYKTGVLKVALIACRKPEAPTNKQDLLVQINIL